MSIVPRLVRLESLRSVDGLTEIDKEMNRALAEAFNNPASPCACGVLGGGPWGSLPDHRCPALLQITPQGLAVAESGQ